MRAQVTCKRLLPHLEPPRALLPRSLLPRIRLLQRRRHLGPQPAALLLRSLPFLVERRSALLLPLACRLHVRLRRRHQAARRLQLRLDLLLLPR